MLMVNGTQCCIFNSKETEATSMFICSASAFPHLVAKIMSSYLRAVVVEGLRSSVMSPETLRTHKYHDSLWPECSPSQALLCAVRHGVRYQHSRGRKKQHYPSQLLWCWPAFWAQLLYSHDRPLFMIFVCSSERKNKAVRMYQFFRHALCQPRAVYLATRGLPLPPISNRAGRQCSL
ncbi:hypothetical protein BC567DRAFT_68796 [Phyllosticta citribraziliensis]